MKTLSSFDYGFEISTCCHGQFSVRILYRGEWYHCYSNNTLAYDRLHEDISDRAISCGYTLRQAFQTLYDECKQKNGLK